MTELLHKKRANVNGSRDGVAEGASPKGKGEAAAASGGGGGGAKVEEEEESEEEDDSDDEEDDDFAPSEGGDSVR